jgi:glyoxylase-like metal-dependent hydrolase (beta-lactamase superfamily II)
MKHVIFMEYYFMSKQHKGIFSAIFLSLLFSVSASAEQPKKETATDILSSYETKKIAEHTWFIPGPLEGPNPVNRGFMNNPSFVVTEKSVIVIDPGGTVEAGRGLLKRIQKQTKNPVTHVFNTHIHGDHWLGNQAFVEANKDVKIYAHPKMIELAKDGEGQVWVDMMLRLTEGASKETAITLPTDALKDQQEVKVDNITIKAHLNKKAHTLTDAMFEIVEDKVLITGDNAFNNRAPRLDDGSYIGNIAVMDKAIALPIDVVIPGHGPVGGKEILENFKTFLSLIYNTTKKHMDDDLEAHEIKPKVIAVMGQFKDWTNYEGAIGKLVSVAALEVEENDF